MCWIGHTSDKKIAEKDIKCKKVVNKSRSVGSLRPYFRHSFCSMEYHIGETYTARIELTYYYPTNQTWTCEIHEGIHCYSNEVKINTINHGVGNTAYGIHFIGHNENSPSDTIFWENRGYRTVILECTIPKGTTYYENKKGEIVTEKLRIDRIIPYKEI